MRITMMTVHIVTGGLGLLSGFVALYAAKGATLHRASGTVFVYSMVTMAMLGVAIAAVWGRAASLNVPVGLLTTYLVITSLTTVTPTHPSRRVQVGLLLVALAIAASMLLLGIGTILRGKSSGFLVPVFIFAAVALLGGAGDVRVLRSGVLTGGRRVARHLWRMSMALMIASLSFSVRLPRILPEPLRTPVIYSLPTLAVLGTMVYWLWRVRSTRSSHALVVSAARGNLASEAV
jgi:uncharacterized membrane protein